jgi:hypothetical protein
MAPAAKQQNVEAIQNLVISSSSPCGKNEQRILICFALAFFLPFYFSNLAGADTDWQYQIGIFELYESH